MKKRLFLSSLLAICVTCVAQADELSVSGTKTIDGDLTTNRLTITTNSTLIVNGKTTINSNLPNGNSNLLYSGSKLETSAITFNCATTSYAKQLMIQGTVKTNEFTVQATEEYPAIVTVTNNGKIKSLNEVEPGTLKIGANVEFIVGMDHEKYPCEIDLKTVINGGTLNVHDYVTMGDITLDSGVINIYNVEITRPNQTLSPDDSLKLGALTVNAGILNIERYATTGALTLNNCTVNFAADAAIDLGEESLILGDNVAITLNVDSLDDIEGVTLFKTTGKVEGFEDITVTFVDATGTTKEAAVSYSNGSVVTTAIPEPATATLSLLALAGLAARRRRR